jgi:hypothetical protein
MKERTILWLCDYSYRITSYIFWVYFLFVVALDIFDIGLGKIVAYIFWLLLGFYLGFTVALKVVKYMRRKEIE